MPVSDSLFASMTLADPRSGVGRTEALKLQHKRQSKNVLHGASTAQPKVLEGGSAGLLRWQAKLVCDYISAGVEGHWSQRCNR